MQFSSFFIHRVLQPSSLILYFHHFKRNSHSPLLSAPGKHYWIRNSGSGPQQSPITNLPDDADAAEDYCSQERLSVPWLVGTSGVRPFWWERGGGWHPCVNSQWISISPIPCLTMGLCVSHLLSAAVYSLYVPDNGIHALMHWSSLSHPFSVLQRFAEISCLLKSPFLFLLIFLLLFWGCLRKEWI